jgi:peptidyl-prolyl cis-trans isomerase D
MATLQKIRNNIGPLVLIFVGVALFAFIVGDFFRADQKLIGKSKNEVAEIEGKSVPVQYFQQKIDENTELYKRNSGKNNVDNQTLEQIQDQTWEQLIRENVLDEEFAKIGVQVSEDELFDMVQGNNIDPQIKQIPIFQNKQTGQFDRNLVIQFLKNKEQDPSGNAVTSWNAFEKGLVENKVNEKYYAIVGKGMFVTSLQAKKEVANKNTKYDFDYVQVRYNTLSDSAVSFTDSELKAYYKKNESKFEQEESREIYYVTFDIVPSADDHAQTIKWVEKLKQEFATTPTIEQFVNLNSDVAFNPKHFTQEELPASIASLYSAPEGTIIGPYEEEGIVKIARSLESVNIPDSVEARHILIRPNEKLSQEAAKAKADSLLAVIRKGGNFAELAKQFSQDGSAEKGGDLGWFKEGAMVPSFGDACFKGKKGDIVVVESQFGYHIIEVLNQSKPSKKVQVAILERIVNPSTKTVDNTYAMASKFGSKNRDVEAFRNSANLENLSLKTANVKRADRRLANFENPRGIIRWAFKAEKGAVSEIFEFDNQYVLAALKTVREKGIAPFEEVKADVEHEVRNDKKAESLIAKLKEAANGASTLQMIADRVSSQVKEAKSVNFAAYSIPGLGFEPELQASISSLPAQQISEPIKGKAGVYVVQVKNVINPGAEADVKREKDMLSRAAQSRVSYQVFNAIRDAAKITDNRPDFY